MTPAITIAAATNAETVVAIDRLSVLYGSERAVDDVTLHVSRGAVYALLGRNGAGKSSLVRCLLGLQKASRGSVRLFGDDVWNCRASLMERVGVVAEEGDAPPEMRVEAIARFSRDLYSRWDQRSVDERLRRLSIAPHAKFGELSKGQKKQVALAMALASSPEMLVLDDPTLGLDVVARKSLFEEVIAELADRGTTVLITTHDLSGVEAIADRVGLLSNGRLVLDEAVESLKGRFRRVRTAARPAALTDANLATAKVRSWGSGTEAVVTNFDEPAFERFRSGVEVVEATPLSLEEIFIALDGEEGAGRE